MSAAGRPPSLRVERELLRTGVAALACVDEVGRGALAGPVTVGVVVVTAGTRTAPAGVRDSKLLAPSARVSLVPSIQRWATAWAVGHATAAEIDEVGIIAAQRRAARRALADLSVPPDMVLLDGTHDYLTDPAQGSLFGADPGSDDAVIPVVTRVRADLTCSAVAAASVLAKVARDSIMVDLAVAFPAYAWGVNKGYAAPDHLAALRRHGPTSLHRRSWNLPA